MEVPGPGAGTGRVVPGTGFPGTGREKEPHTNNNGNKSALDKEKTPLHLFFALFSRPQIYASPQNSCNYSKPTSFGLADKLG